MNEKQSKRGFVSSDMWTRLITFETSMYTISLWSWRSLYINNTGKLYIWSRNILYCTIDNWNFRFVSWCIIFSCIYNYMWYQSTWNRLVFPDISSGVIKHGTGKSTIFFEDSPMKNPPFIIFFVLDGISPSILFP